MAAEQTRYTRTHLWCRIEADGAMTIGITDTLAQALGDVLYAELPDVGDDVLNDVPFAELETSGRIASLLPPADGGVVSVNPRILDGPDTLTDVPVNERWLIRIRLSEPVPEGRLLSAEEYEALLKRG